MFHDRNLLAGTALSRPAVKRIFTRDAFQTFDSATIDSTGAFLIGQLERLDTTLHAPLFDFQWSRDIDLRSDVSIADDTSSFTVSSFGASGGSLGAQGGPSGQTKAWIASNATALPSVSVDKGKVATPLTPWGTEISYTIFELESSMKLGTSIDQEKIAALQYRYQADIDAQVYIGDQGLGLYGLTNLNLRSDSSQVTNLANVAAGVESGTPTKWQGGKSPAEILADVNEILMSRWAAMGFVLEDTRVLLPTSQYGYISTETVSTAGSVSILTYLLENNFITKSGKKLEIFPSKWLNGRGVGGTPETLGTTDRMMAYSKRQERVRFPLVPIERTNIQFRSIWQVVSYYSKLGAIEAVYPEAIVYRDGL